MLKNTLLLIIFPLFVFSHTVAIISDSIGSDHKFPSFPVLFQRMNKEMIVINNFQGCSTVESGFERLQSILDTDKLDFLVITLGINDALAGFFSAEKIYNDFNRITELAQSYKIHVIVGTIDFTAYHYVLNNRIYELELESIYVKLECQGITLFKFLSKELLQDPSNTIDGIHPTLKGQKIIAESLNQNIHPFIEK